MRKPNTRLILSERDKETIKRGLWELDGCGLASFMLAGYNLEHYKDNLYLVYKGTKIIERLDYTRELDKELKTAKMYGLL